MSDGAPPPPDPPPSSTSVDAMAEVTRLLAKWRSGDEHALWLLLEPLQGKVYALCYRTLGNHHDASDLAQASLVRIIQGLGTFDGRSRLSTWAYRVTMNCCLSHLRREKIRDHASLEGLSEAAGHPIAFPSEEPTASSSVENAEEEERVVQGLDLLDASTRMLIVLRDVHGLEYAHLAEVLGVPLGTIKSRLFRARAALRHAVGSLRQPRSLDRDQGGGETPPSQQ
jgi:RNA polymerase sigma-70 factor (ECF subfamily)